MKALIGTAQIEAIARNGPDNRKRRPGTDYLFELTMTATFNGGTCVKATRVHSIPPNRTHLVDEGRRYPVTADPKEPKSFEIDWVNFKKVDGRKVLNQIVSRAAPLLEAEGFKKVTPRTFNCTKEDGLVHVVGFQPAAEGGEFTVNVAVYVREFNSRSSLKVNEKRVEEDRCTHKLRWRIGHLAKKSDLWWSYDDPDKASRELEVMFRQFVFPHLARHASRTRLRGARSKSARKRCG